MKKKKLDLFQIDDNYKINCKTNNKNVRTSNRP